MNQAIADIIKGHISGLDFIDKIAGLTSVLTFDMRGPDNVVVQKSFPVACCVTPDECEKQGAYNDLMPNSEYKSVIYFEDGGLTFEKYEGNWKYYKSSLRLIAWLNIEKLTESGICKSEIPCTYAAHVITEIIRALPEFPQNTHGPIERVYSEITSQIVRNPSIFSAYTYDEKHVQYLMAPFDYFALTIETSFAICLSSRVTPDSTCVPAIELLPPTALILTAFSDTQIDLAWTNNALNQAVSIERSLNGNDFVEIHRTLPGVAVYSDTGLIEGTRYYYRARAFSGGDYSAYTSVEDAIPIYWMPQRIADTFLFFGETSNIYGGRLNNQVIGSSDWLTVAGSVGSETYQAPDNAAYKTADTDYIWFKTDTTQRIVTTAELIGYDFPRTIVKYDDTTPYAISIIAILKTGVSITDHIRDTFHLSVWWNNLLSTHGNPKGNRNSGQSVFITEANDIFNRMIAVGEAPEVSRRLLIQDRISLLKINNLWGKFDAIWTPAAHGTLSSRFNWIQNAYNLTDGIAPIFEIDRGITGNGSTMYLKTGISPVAGGFKFIRNDASFGYYSRTNIAGTVTDMGYYHATIGRNTMNSRSLIDKYQTYINGQTVQSLDNIDSTGFYCAVRNSATTVSTYKNKVKTNANTNSSGTAGEPYLLAVNSAGTPSSWSQRQIALAFMGSKLTEAEENLFYDIMVDGYLNSIGAKI